MKLSIIVLTYNQLEFIAQALDSVLLQKVDFSYEIIVADDGSTDGTLEIINEFERKHPNLVVVLSSNENRGILSNAARVMNVVNGKYIALLDGDDYWEYEHKLQKQIDFLDANPEYNGVFHDAKIVHEEIENKGDIESLFVNKKSYSQYYNYNNVVYPSDIINRIILPTASTVLRSDFLFKESLNIITDNYSLDWKLFCLAIKSSKFVYINEEWSVYRNHSKGVSKSNKDEFHLSHIKFLKKLLRDDFYKHCRKDIYSSIANEYKILLNSKQSKLNKRKLFRKYFFTEIILLGLKKRETT